MCFYFATPREDRQLDKNMPQSDDVLQRVARRTIAHDAASATVAQGTTESWACAAHSLGTYVGTTTANARARDEVAARPEYSVESSISLIAHSLAFPQVESELRFRIDSLRRIARQTELKRRRVEADVHTYERALTAHSLKVQQESDELRLDKLKLHAAIDKMEAAIQGQ